MLKKVSTYVAGALLVGLILATFGSAAIKGVFGFAVAGSANKWHNVKDFSAGDNLTTGSMSVIPCMYDGTNCDRLRGDVTNGLDVDVTRVGGTVSIAGGTTPADNAANPTTALITDSRLSAFDGSTWDRLFNSTHGDNLSTTRGLNTASFLYGFDGTTYDRIRGDSTNGLDVKITNATAVGGTVNQSVLLNGVTTTQFSLDTSLTTVLCDHSWTVILTGSPTAVTVSIEGSLDSNEWFTLDSSTAIINTLRHFNGKCVPNIRANLSVLTGGTSPTVTVKSASLGD